MIKEEDNEEKKIEKREIRKVTRSLKKGKANYAFLKVRLLP